MGTTKPISTISYNSEEFLKYHLEKWYNAHLIQSYQYIKHKGEDGDKDHIHLRIEPNKRIDPMDFMEELKEYDPKHDKPLCCRPFRPSVEEDWFLYAVHDPQYLKIKYGGGEKGEKIPYSYNDIVVPEYYDTEIAFVRAKAKLEHTTVNMAEKLQKGVSPFNLILQGENPHTVNALMTAISKTDYQELNNKYQGLQLTHEILCQAILNYGLCVDWYLNDDGKECCRLFAPTNSEQKKV